MTRYVLGNLRSGRPLIDLPVVSGPWDVRLNTAGSITCKLDLNDPDVQHLDLLNTSTPTQTFLGVVEGDRIVEAGPIWTRSYSRSTRILELRARGLASYFDHRLVLPTLAKTLPTDQWTVPVPDPESPGETMIVPNPYLATTMSGLSLGTIAKRLVQQARAWTGGNVPIVFQDDEAADHTRTYNGIDFKSVLEAIEDIADVEGGPDFVFAPRFTADRLGVEWVFGTGTELQPLIVSGSVPRWDVTLSQSAVVDLEIDEDGSTLASLGWQLGGKQVDAVLVARAYDSSLVDAKFPLLELVDTSHSTVSLQPTLDAYAVGSVAAAQRSQEIWKLTVKVDPRDEEGLPAGPSFGSYQVGDYAEISMESWRPGSDVGPECGDPYLAAGGVSRHRIVGLSGDERGEVVEVYLAPRLE